MNLKNYKHKISNNKKSISPLIAIILLVVVAVVLVTLLLGWGKNLASDNLDKTNNFKQEYTADTLTMFDADNFTNSKLLAKNLKSNGEVTITSYKILSDSSHPLLNKINTLPEPVSLDEGDTKFIPMVQPPERTFDVQLMTDENKYIDVKNVNYTNKNVFAKTFGGSNTDRSRSITQTKDGAYILSGYTESFGAGGPDILFIKISNNGNIDWNKTFGGSNYDKSYSVQEINNGYMLAGRTDFYGVGGDDLWLIKTDYNGTPDWNVTYGGSLGESTKSTIYSSNLGFVFAATTSSYGSGDTDIWLLKTDSDLSTCDYASNNGECISNNSFAKVIGATGYESARSVKEISDGGYIFAGYTSSSGAGSYDVWLAKVNSTGVLDWNKTLGSTGSDRAYSVYETKDNGFIIAAQSDSFTANTDLWIIKTDSEGNTCDYSIYGNCSSANTFCKLYGGSGNDKGYTIQQTIDNGFILGAYTSSYGSGAYDFWLLKLNIDGNIEWERTFGSSNNDVLRSIEQTSDSGYIMTGYTESYSSSKDVWIIKTDSEGRTCNYNSNNGNCT